MNRISIHPVALTLFVFLSGGVGAVGAELAGQTQIAKAHQDGVMSGRLAAQREAAISLSTMMTNGVSVREDDGSESRFVLTPIRADN